MHRDFFMAGMPGSGKTTYLASLWTLLSEGCVSTMYKKEVGVMPEDCAMLNQIAQEILSYKDIERTKIGEKVKLMFFCAFQTWQERFSEIWLRTANFQKRRF